MIELQDGTKRFESIEELVDHLERGDEIEFTYQNEEKSYWLMLIKGLYTIYRSYDETFDYQFATADELLNFIFDGQKLKDIILSLPVIDNSFN